MVMCDICATNHVVKKQYSILAYCKHSNYSVEMGRPENETRLSTIRSLCENEVLYHLGALFPEGHYQTIQRLHLHSYSNLFSINNILMHVHVLVLIVFE